MLYTIYELAVCGVLFLFAKYLTKHGKPAIQWHDGNDPSIRKPFVLPTFSMEMIVSSSLLGPLVTMVAVYLFDSQLVDPRLFTRFIYGWCLNSFVCYFFKSIVGRLRPNFMAINTEEIATGRELYMAILARNPDYKKFFILESRKSFYSGHAAASTFAGTFTVLFLHSLAPRADLLLSTVKVLIFIFSLYPGITQGICFFHHWTDVIAGHLFGAIFASFAFYCVQ